MLAQRIARWRVTIGFVCAAFVLWFARPTWQSLAIGAAIAVVGEALRIWAAGHVEKGREVTSSGPYQYFRHPLYVGSAAIGGGVAIASNSPIVAGVALAYLAITLTAAIRSEESHLREKFGGSYDAYAAGQATAVARAFSLSRALRNREHHATLGLLASFALLALKVKLSIS